jgi:type IV secretion system protein VirB9
MKHMAITAGTGFAALLVAAAAISHASSEPTAYASYVDARIRTLMYDPDRVVPLNAFFGYQLMIQFGADERIENVAIGDGATWQVTPNRGANLLFVKPIDRAGRTNMTVVTDRRSYLFELNANPSRGVSVAEMTYVVRFSYPPEPVVVVSPPPPPPPPPNQRNRAYTYTGSRALLPSLVFDDGQFTYFKWPESESTPAVFLLADNGSESVADYSFRDGYQVVEQVAPRFRLRNGKEVTTLINEGWRDPTPGDGAPRPHDAKTARDAAHAERQH